MFSFARSISSRSATRLAASKSPMLARPRATFSARTFLLFPRAISTLANHTAIPQQDKRRDVGLRVYFATDADGEIDDDNASPIYDSDCDDNDNMASAEDNDAGRAIKSYTSMRGRPKKGSVEDRRGMYCVGLIEDDYKEWMRLNPDESLAPKLTTEQVDAIINKLCNHEEFGCISKAQTSRQLRDFVKKRAAKARANLGIGRIQQDSRVPGGGILGGETSAGASSKMGKATQNRSLGLGLCKRFHSDDELDVFLHQVRDLMNGNIREMTYEDAANIVHCEFLQYREMDDGRSNEKQVFFDETFVDILRDSESIHELLNRTIDSDTSIFRKELVSTDTWNARARSIINAKVLFDGLVDLYMTGRAFSSPWVNDENKTIQATWFHPPRKLERTVCIGASKLHFGDPDSFNQAVFTDETYLTSPLTTFVIDTNKGHASPNSQQKQDSTFGVGEGIPFLDANQVIGEVPVTRYLRASDGLVICKLYTRLDEEYGTNANSGFCTILFHRYIHLGLANMPVGSEVNPKTGKPFTINPYNDQLVQAHLKEHYNGREFEDVFGYSNVITDADLEKKWGFVPEQATDCDIDHQAGRSCRWMNNPLFCMPASHRLNSCLSVVRTRDGDWNFLLCTRPYGNGND